MVTSISQQFGNLLLKESTNGLSCIGGNMRFTIRDVLLMTVIVAISVGWWLDRSNLERKWRKAQESVETSRFVYGELSARPQSSLQLFDLQGNSVSTSWRRTRPSSTMPVSAVQQNQVSTSQRRTGPSARLWLFPMCKFAAPGRLSVVSADSFSEDKPCTNQFSVGFNLWTPSTRTVISWTTTIGLGIG
jgi:hypothetical protein